MLVLSEETRQHIAWAARTQDVYFVRVSRFLADENKDWSDPVQMRVVDANDETGEATIEMRRYVTD